MTERYEHAKRQALLAREKAMQSESDALRQGWQRVAELWDAIAGEYRTLDTATDDMANPTA